MPEVSLTLLIIAATAALFIGFGAAFLIQKSKIAPLKAELEHQKKENARIDDAASRAEQKCGELNSALSEAGKQLAERDSDIRNISANLYDARQKITELEDENKSLNKLLTVARAEQSTAEEGNRQLKAWIESSKEEMKNSFASLSKDITENNSKVFLDSANDKLGDFAKPWTKSLREITRL